MCGKTHRRKTGRAPPAASPSLLASLARSRSSSTTARKTANSRKSLTWGGVERRWCERGARFFASSRGTTSLPRAAIFPARERNLTCEIQNREERRTERSRARARADANSGRESALGSALCARALCCRRRTFYWQVDRAENTYPGERRCGSIAPFSCVRARIRGRLFTPSRLRDLGSIARAGAGKRRPTVNDTTKARRPFCTGRSAVLVYYARHSWALQERCPFLKKKKISQRRSIIRYYLYGAYIPTKGDCINDGRWKKKAVLRLALHLQSWFPFSFLLSLQARLNIGALICCKCGKKVRFKRADLLIKLLPRFA